MTENLRAPPGCKLPAAGFLGRLHVLVVDDDAVYLEELKLTLLLSGYAVTGKTTAEEALRELDCNPEDYFDIIMTDVDMPGMDGFDLLRGIKGRLPVIMFSEDEDVRTVMRGVLDGACDYLLKPMTSEAIRIIWKHVLHRRLRALPPHASSLPSDRRLVVALSVVAPPAGSRRGDGQEAALALQQLPALLGNKHGDVQEAARAVEEANVALAAQPSAMAPHRNSDRDVQEAVLAQHSAPAPGGKKRGGMQELVAAVAAGSSRGDGQEAAPAVSKRGGGQEAAAVVVAWSSDGDGQEVATNAAPKKRGTPEVSDKGFNNFELTKERKKARSRFVWTTESHRAFLRAYYELEDEAGPKRIKELMEREGIFVTKTQVSSHLQKFRGWLETMKNQQEACQSPYNLLSNYTDRQDRSYSSWKRSSIVTEGPLAGMFCGRPVNHSMATSNGCFIATQSSYVGVGPREIENFISSHQRSQGTTIGQASLRSGVSSAGRDVHANGSSQARRNAVSHGTSASHGVAVTNENLLQVISASLPSNMRQTIQPSQSFSTNGLAANFSAISDQNLGTSCAANSSAINNQNPMMSVQQRAELGYGNNAMLDWPELGGLDDQLDNDLLMNSLFDGDQLQQGVVTATDGTQEMPDFDTDTTGDLISVPPQGLDSDFPSHESTNGMNDASSGGALIEGL